MRKVLYSLMAMMFLASCTIQTEKTGRGYNDYDVVEKVIMSRRSVRQYTDRPINRDTLNEILKCGINAPNGQNRQAYEIRVIDNPKLLSEITEAVVKDNPENAPKNGAENIFVGATCVIFIANDTAYDVSQVDCGLLGENIMLAARAMGLGTCCLGSSAAFLQNNPRAAEYLEKLDLPKGYKLLYCIAVGYPDESPAAKERDASRVKFID